MKIVHAWTSKLSAMSGVQVLIFLLIEQARPEDEMLIISADTEEEMRGLHVADKIQGHFSTPGDLPLSQWNTDLVTWLDEQQVDLCHFHLGHANGWYGREMGACPPTYVAASGFPVITTTHSYCRFFAGQMKMFLSRKRFKKRSRMWLGKIMQLYHIKREVMVSRDSLNSARWDYLPYRSKMLHHYHSSIDAAEIYEEKPRVNVIVSAARIRFSKGQHHLVEAFARICDQHPDWELKVLGPVHQEECMQLMERTIREYGIEDRVSFVGYVEDPLPYYQEAKIYVQASSNEGLSLSLQEAMHYGCACIATDCGGTSEAISDESIGLLFDYGDIDALVNHLERVISSDELRQRLSESAKRQIHELGMNQQEMAKFYRNLYLQVLSE